VVELVAAAHRALTVRSFTALAETRRIQSPAPLQALLNGIDAVDGGGPRSGYWPPLCLTIDHT
jgi:hypothetical protein